MFSERNADLMEKDSDQGLYEKMVYKLLPDPKKMLPKVCFSKKNTPLFQPSPEVAKIYADGSFKNGENFSIKSLHTMIDFYKRCLTQ